MKLAMDDYESFVDEQIQPLLSRVYDLCRDRGVPFLASVQYAPGRLCNTTAIPEGACEALSYAAALLEGEIRVAGVVALAPTSDKAEGESN